LLFSTYKGAGMAERRQIPLDVEHLVELSRLLVSVAYRSLDAASTPIPLRQFRALVLLSRSGPTTAGGLAADLDMVPSTGTRLCDKLVACGWVSRVTRADNRREVELSITGKGQAIVDEVLARRAAELEKVLHRLRPASRTALSALLPELLAAADVATDSARAAWTV